MTITTLTLGEHVAYIAAPVAGLVVRPLPERDLVLDEFSETLHGAELNHLLDALADRNMGLVDAGELDDAASMNVEWDAVRYGWTADGREVLSLRGTAPDADVDPPGTQRAYDELAAVAGVVRLA
jgi:hypothetical protein